MKIVTFYFGSSAETNGVHGLVWQPFFSCSPEFAAELRKSIASARAEAVRTGVLGKAALDLGGIKVPLAAEHCSVESEGSAIATEVGVVAKPSSILLR